MTEFWIVQSETHLTGGLAYWGPYLTHSSASAEAAKMPGEDELLTVIEVPVADWATVRVLHPARGSASDGVGSAE